MKRPAALRLFDTIETQIVRWIDPRRIPLDTLTILDGDPGLGKTTVALDYAARVSRGLEGPGGDQGDLYGIPSGVVVMSAEDDPACTLKPKLEAMGADLKRIGFLDGRRNTDPDLDDEDDEDKVHPIDLKDIDTIADAMDQVKGRLLVVDPLMAYMPANKNAHRDQDVRSVFSPLIHLAREREFAILVIRHLNKVSGGDKHVVSALHRGGGSIGIAGASRSTLLVALDNTDDKRQRRILVRVKGNLSPEPIGLAFHLEATHPDPAIVAWDGPVADDADSLLRPSTADYEPTRIAEACAWLLARLQDGPQGVNALLRDAKKIDLHPQTVRRAKDRLGAQGKYVEKVWSWFIPDDGKTSEQRLQQPLRGRPSRNGNRVGMVCHWLPELSK